MMDQERDPVGYAQCQDAGRVAGIAAANDRDSIEDVVDEMVARMWPQKPHDPEKESELARAIREREQGPW